MNKKIIYCCIACISVFSFNGCSTDGSKSFIKKEISVPENNNTSLVSQTTLNTKESGHITINEICINGVLVVFIDGYKSGGAVNMGISEKCKEGGKNGFFD